MIAVIGEALIDLVEDGDDDPRLARPGGSPYNVAIGLARLGQHAMFVGRMSRDPLGTVLRNHAARSDVDLSLVVDAYEPSTVALVELAADGSAGYHFGVDGTADFRWTDAELAAVPVDIAGVHFGSLASWLAPGDAVIARRVAALRDAGVAVSYDPNVRPTLQPDRSVARDHVERGVALAHVVKTSDEDVAYLYGDEPVESVAQRWLGDGTSGPALVVVTRGADGAVAVTRTGVVGRPQPPCAVVDTVGAGDAFTAGLLDGLSTRGLFTADALAGVGTDDLVDVLDHAGRVAGITCSRAGANPPWRRELSGATTS